jgi:hypothetical protein
VTTNSTRGLLVAVLIVSSASLLLTAVQLGMTLVRPATTQSDEQQASLPSRYDEAELARISDIFVEPYNRNDVDALYEILDPVAKSQVPRSKLVETIGKLRPTLGKIESSSYVSFRNISSQGLEMIQLNYVVSLSGGQITSGTLQINIIDRKSGPGIVGFLLNGQTQ